jgi:hypothetical protein
MPDDVQHGPVIEIVKSLWEIGGLPLVLLAALLWRMRVADQKKEEPARKTVRKKRTDDEQ